MTTITQEPGVGFYWHVHHDILVEWCHTYKERVEAIKRYKPETEQGLRLRLLQPVRGPLPPAFVKAWATYSKAEATYSKEWGAYSKEWATYSKARDEAMPALVALHAQECKNCPWNGTTIFGQQAVAP